METRTLVPTTLEPAAELDRLGDEIAELSADSGLPEVRAGGGRAGERLTTWWPCLGLILK
jgi:hypothetical protein